MKKLILLLFIFFAFASSAQAITPTIAANDVVGWQYGTSQPVTLRIYSNTSFFTSTGERVQAGTVGTNTFFRSYACTFPNSTTVRIPVINNLPTTTDGQDKATARYTAVFYQGSTKRDEYLSNFVLSHTLGMSLTWSRIAIFNAAYIPFTDTQTLSRTQIANMIASAVGSQVNATVGTKGLTELSAVPVDLSRPIAVGKNDLATTANAGIVTLAASGEATAGEVVQGSDSRLAAATTTNRGTVTITGSNNQVASTDDPRLAPASTTNRGTVTTTTDSSTVLSIDDERIADFGGSVANTPNTAVKRGASSEVNVSTVQVGGTQVLGAQQPAVENADGTLASATSQLNLLLAAIRTHGLIATTVTPSSVPGLIADWNPDTIAGADGTPIASVTDSSGNGHTLTQGSAGNKPLLKTSQVNGHAAIRFDGTDDWLDFSSISNIRVAFLVVKHSIATPNMDTQVQGLVIGDSSDTSWAGDSGIQMTSYVTGLKVLNGSAYEAGVSIPVASLAKSPLQYQLYTIVTTANTPARYLGFERSQFWQGDVARVLLYSAVPSTAQRQGLENYLKAAYNITLPKAVIFDGNSLTTDRYYESQVLPSQVWTSQIQPLLAAGGFGIYDWFNFAHNGQNQTQMNAAAPNLIDPLCAMGRAKCIDVNWEGTNQISTSTTGHDTYLLTLSYGQARKAAGAQVITLTAIKRGDWAAPYEVQRQAYNSELLANCSTVATSCINLDTVDYYNNTTGVLGADGTPDFNDPNNTLFYTADKLHITALGNSVVARAVNAAILALP